MIEHRPISHSANLVVDNDLLRISGQARVHRRTHRARTDAPRPHLTPCNAYKQTANPLSGRPAMYVVCRLLIKGDLRPRSHSAKRIPDRLINTQREPLSICVPLSTNTARTDTWHRSALCHSLDECAHTVSKGVFFTAFSS